MAFPEQCLASLIRFGAAQVATAKPGHCSPSRGSRLLSVHVMGTHRQIICAAETVVRSSALGATIVAFPEQSRVPRRAEQCLASLIRFLALRRYS